MMQKTANGNWPLYLVWLIVLGLAIGISFVSRVESTRFSGIAETREIIVNSETAVDIKRISVTEGQIVDKGQILVELSSPELDLKINQISHQLDQLKAQKGVDKAELRSRLRQFRAEKAAKENEIKNQIAELENQYAINKALVKELKSISTNKTDSGNCKNSPLQVKIIGLKKELRLSVSPLEIQIELLEKMLKASDSPVRIQVERLDKELTLLKKEKNRLNIYAQISGVIGSVNFKPGEKASPFAPILTLHTKNPSFIKGYIFENVYSSVSIGDKVNVAACADAGNRVDGVVTGVGARIVEYPVRLRKHSEIQAWGREVVIRISEDNPFILGEKVIITSSFRTIGFVDRLRSLFRKSEAIADTKNGKRENTKQAEI